ncbi:serine O-acetyltransferase [Ahrensia sp. R2A130]|uniref:serine O-acetyltransferase n=1 Tax=Ahrensia sp. R2A130 TaxID=744979 RepID=UPI0001E0F82B|nr:serine O-acetyltransferase [Ahrensia sp. R2A130]EFL90467.1 serine acetyltransferase [Ahrensia sp. R2A130]
MSASDTIKDDPVVHLDPVWGAVREEAQAALDNDPALGGFLFRSILSQKTLEQAVITRIAHRLEHADLCADTIRATFEEMIRADPEWSATMRVDIAAVYDRDPACTRFIEPILYFKGFHALQTHRLAHWAFKQGRRDFALYLQSRSSEVFQTDINPEARFGRGVFIDHATGLVVGATAVVGNDVSIMQGVTLGGTGKESGDRHPKVQDGVLIGAGAKVLGNIEIGHCSRIASGALVVKAVPPKTTVAGVPARVVGVAGCAQPSRTMDQILAETVQQ